MTTTNNQNFAGNSRKRSLHDKPEMFTFSSNSLSLKGKTISVQKIINPPPELDNVKNETERRLIIQILCIMCAITKKSSKIQHGMETCSGFYKIFTSGYRGRITLEDLQMLKTDINEQEGWTCVREVYFESDARRIVVEMNKENMRQFQPSYKTMTKTTSTMTVQDNERKKRKTFTVSKEESTISDGNQKKSIFASIAQAFGDDSDEEEDSQEDPRINYNSQIVSVHGVDEDDDDREDS